MKTTIRLRNKITGLYYVEGKHFSGTESEATVIERNSPNHIGIRYTYMNTEDVEIPNPRRVTKKDMKIEETKAKAKNKAEALESAAYEASIYGKHRESTSYRVRAFNIRQKYQIA